jgi:hypothetical protein
MRFFGIVQDAGDSGRLPAVMDSAVLEMASAVLWMEEGSLLGKQREKKDPSK